MRRGADGTRRLALDPAGRERILAENAAMVRRGLGGARRRLRHWRTPPWVPVGDLEEGLTFPSGWSMIDSPRPEALLVVRTPRSGDPRGDDHGDHPRAACRGAIWGSGGRHGGHRGRVNDAPCAG